MLPKCLLSSSVLFQALGPYTHKTHKTYSKTHTLSLYIHILFIFRKVV